MNLFSGVFFHRRSSLLWSDEAPVREELFGGERLEQHAESLAAAQSVAFDFTPVLPLHTRLRENAKALRRAYKANLEEMEKGRDTGPAAEWLLDNYHLVEEQIREIRDDLPPGYYRLLPKLATGPFAGYPRVFGLTWAFVAHTDSHFDPAILCRFITAYQRVQPLTIGELWAVAITLRIVFVENLRRLADQIAADRTATLAADDLADRLLEFGHTRANMEGAVFPAAPEPLSERFAAQLAKRLRDHDPHTTPALGWLEDRLKLQNVSIDDAVRHSHQRQGVSNVTVRNIITSMRLISDVDWADLFESISLVDARLRAASGFAAMDFPTRNLYRSAIEHLARGSKLSELEVVGRVLGAARAVAAGTDDASEARRVGDPGYHLIGRGRRAFEETIGFRPPFRLWIHRFNVRLGVGGYVGAILSVTAAALALALWVLADFGLGSFWLAGFAALAFLPATEIAAALVNRAAAWTFGATALPGLELIDGVPPSLRTVVAVPTMLTSEADLLEQIERLEIHHLSGASGDLTFMLLLDGIDADEEVLPRDAALLTLAAGEIDRLNRRHGPGPGGGSRFLLLHRRRLFNPGENKWMGWERKRGKLHELNRLLRGATDTTFIPIAGEPPRVPPGVRYVITLDADTRLPRDAALRLIGKMAHPLNRPKFSRADNRVTDGYAILQPRVTPALPLGREGSFYQRVFSGPGGMDPYASAASDVYQDLFGEGSYTGKGIYDVDAFEAALSGRVPDNAMLSHDLFEGIFARAGLASDIEVVEDFPSRYDVAAKRQHRWTRGDWQLLPWALGFRSGARALPPLGRWKMFDNLRRSLLAPFVFAALAYSWTQPGIAGMDAGLLVLSAIAVPAFFPVLFSVLPRRSDCRLRAHLAALAADLRLAAMQSLLSVVFLADRAWRTGDAVARTLVRLFATRRHLLEWTTAAQSSKRPRLGIPGFYREMAGGVALGLSAAAGALAAAPTSWPLILPFALLWLAAPGLALWSSHPRAVSRRLAVSAADARTLRLIARRTWRFFETFVTDGDNMLPPDNYQEDTKPVVAHRTSPTNIGLYLLSAVAARDLGWTGTGATLARLEATFVTLRKMRRFKGHFYNWYDTRDLRPLDPPYVSSVDSGNLAGHLIALANACEEWAETPLAATARAGLKDTLALVRDALETGLVTNGEHGRALAATLTEIETRLAGAQAFDTLFPTLKRLSEKTAVAARACLHENPGDTPDLIFWAEALQQAVADHLSDRTRSAEEASRVEARLRALASTARGLALEMNFAFLLDPERKLLSIGYSLTDNRLDPSCYDLLASEARLASLCAVAKGDLPTRHWFRLGRAATPLGNGSALISWSGSMFEYLMPSLVMRAPIGSLLEQTSRLVVARQKSYARTLGVPWGISESAYNVRDVEFTYQYSNFGIPGLGLKRGLSENVVIAPYATGLAAMIDPPGACANYARLAAMGACGRYGFYEALDFTRSRLPDDADVAVIHSFMAHHQGMTIAAIANAVQNGLMRARFHREPMIRASELLLQERMPRDVAVAQPHAEEATAYPDEAWTEVPTVRRLKAATAGPPVTHLLSNGRYAVMLTTAGAGYSRWRDIAVTRWREDATRDNWGSFVFLRDAQSGNRWSAAAFAEGSPPDDEDVVFGEDHARFTRRDGPLTTIMEILVSGEDDGEVRRVSLVNSGRRLREIALTSYAEVVLATAATDVAHPAFAKMFVETEYLAEFGALIATRRPREANEERIWAAHFAVVEGDIATTPQYETDRAAFLGRGHGLAAADAVAGDRPLSNTTGVVLDPIFSIRQQVLVPPGSVVRVVFWTVVASSREELLGLIDKHHDRNAFARAKTLAWTQAQVQMRHIGVKAEEAADFQRLAAPILYADPRFRPHPEVIARGASAQSDLWPLGISGDRPIVVLRIDDIEDIAQVHQLLRAHEYWRMKRLSVDLVIVNERASSYTQDLQTAIETAVRSSQLGPEFGEELAQGSVSTLRADLIGPEARALLQSVARVTIGAGSGPLADQLARVPSAPTWARSERGAVIAASPVAAKPAQPSENLEFFNGLGGFGRDGREYVTLLDAARTTPAPWINVVANPDFGFQASAEGSGYTWAGSSRENQLTPWSNDPSEDPAGEAIYVRDEITGELWSPTAQPFRDGGSYVARHGYGYCRFEHRAGGIAFDLLQYVPFADPIKISRLTLKNLSGRPRRLSVTSYAEWVLGTVRGVSGPFIITEVDAATGALLARNPWSNGFSGSVAFADLGGCQTALTADRTEFLGRNGGVDAPAALCGTARLSGSTGAGFDPCAALQTVVDLGAGETREIVAFIGQCGSVEEVRELIARYRTADLDGVLAEVTEHWNAVLGAIAVKTPDRAMDVMLNGWLLYQTLACRIWARSAFYQASGAYGFRDQLQDGMALSFARPEETRAHLLRAAARQFVEGDVQHWWLPGSGAGVRTRISDDRGWLAYAAATYVAASGDTAVLDEIVPFLDGPLLHDGEDSAFFQPTAAVETASLFEHCARALDRSLERLGEHGLPLIGAGDWNDGMNRLGAGGKGESVWLAWLLVRTVDLFAPLADRRDADRTLRWRTQAVRIRHALERDAWDGAWYRRATFDDGTWIGAVDCDECRIDSIAQSWAVLGGGDPARAAMAMVSLDLHLIRRDDGLALLFAPPFDKTPRDPGYIKGYPPGVRENGGQYSHAAMWAILAHARRGEGGKAADLFALLNPINHARTPEQAERYKVEAYVVAADVYSVAPHAGRGGWTWYTGSAAWMYRAGMEGILGIRREGTTLVVAPCLPPEWPGFEAKVTLAGTCYDIRVEARRGGRRVVHARLDGEEVSCDDGEVRVASADGGAHELRLELG